MFEPKLIMENLLCQTPLDSIHSKPSGQEKHGGLLQQRAGDGDPLLLATRELRPPAASKRASVGFHLKFEGQGSAMTSSCWKCKVRSNLNYVTKNIDMRGVVMQDWDLKK